MGLLKPGLISIHTVSGVLNEMIKARDSVIIALYYSTPISFVGWVGW